MAKETIEVRIASDGTITAETHNMSGAKCLDYISVLEDLLDSVTQSSGFTADYYAQQNSVETGVSNELRQQ